MLLKLTILPTITSFLMIIGINLNAITIPIHLGNINYSIIEIGVISAAYYSGMAYGSFKIEKMVWGTETRYLFSVFFWSEKQAFNDLCQDFKVLN